MKLGVGDVGRVLACAQKIFAAQIALQSQDRGDDFGGAGRGEREIALPFIEDPSRGGVREKGGSGRELLLREIGGE